MTEPGKNRSPLELEVMELLELRERLEKTVAQLRAEYDEIDSKLRVVQRNAKRQDPSGVLDGLRAQSAYLEENGVRAAKGVVVEARRSLNAAIKLMEVFVEEQPEES